MNEWDKLEFILRMKYHNNSEYDGYDFNLTQEAAIDSMANG